MTDVSVETSSEDLPFVVPPGVAPADLVAELASALPERAGEEYLVYERDGRWILASGVQVLVELDTDELRVATDGDVGSTGAAETCSDPSGPRSGSTGPVMFVTSRCTSSTAVSAATAAAPFSTSGASTGSPERSP